MVSPTLNSSILLYSYRPRTNPSRVARTIVVLREGDGRVSAWGPATGPAAGDCADAASHAGASAGTSSVGATAAAGESSAIRRAGAGAGVSVSAPSGTSSHVSGGHDQGQQLEDVDMANAQVRVVFLVCF